ncbi:MAG: hypothetical protein U0744_16795 [Gemmataceae bacterium]
MRRRPAGSKFAAEGRLRLDPHPKGSPPVPVLGTAIGVMAVLVGLAMVFGGIGLTIVISTGGDFKPAGLIVFSLPGLFWLVAGTLLLSLKGRFAYPFAVFLIANILLGTLFTTAGRSWGRANDARIFALIGLGFIGGAVLFQIFHAFLIRDLRRQKKESEIR